MHEGGVDGLSRREIDALVGELIRAEDSGEETAQTSRPSADTPADTRPTGRLLPRLIRAGVWLSVLLVLGACAAVVAWWPRYTDHGLPTRPTTYADGQYAFLLMQPTEPTVPVGFNPCRPVGVAINYGNATPTIRADVIRIIATLNRVSGLHLRYVGASARALPAADNGILVSFAEPGSYPEMTEPMIGMGGAWSFQHHPAGGVVYFDSGFVTLNLRRYNDASHSRQLLALARQFGHAVGLANISGRELMNSDQPRGLHHWAHGDLTGLARLGQLPCR